MNNYSSDFLIFSWLLRFRLQSDFLASDCADAAHITTPTCGSRGWLPVLARCPVFSGLSGSYRGLSVTHFSFPASRGGSGGSLPRGKREEGANQGWRTAARPAAIPHEMGTRREPERGGEQRGCCRRAG